jgi:hypothetical protein
VTERFAGKYQGLVVDNEDPKKLSRLRVHAPEVFGDETTGWALPCSPYAGPGVGLAVVPPVGSLVFVEWPAGDTSRVPIWSGGSWSDGDGVAGAGPLAFVLTTPAGHKIVLNDEGGGESIEIESASGAKIKLDADGVAIEFGSQKLAMTSSSVSVNGGALEVS